MKPLLLSILSNRLKTQYFGESASTPNAGAITYIDRSIDLTIGRRITHIGLYSDFARGALKLKIVKRNSAENYDIVVSEAFSHSGTGWEFLALSSMFIVPEAAHYIGMYHSQVGPMNVTATGARAYKAGDITGTGQTGFIEGTSAVLVFAIKYK